MPQPQAPPRAAAAPRGNSAMAQFKPKRWQVEDRCGLCSIEFSLMNKRHHCRHCGLSVCGKHSRNKVIVPTSLSKVPQRVCDKCYPKCRSIARGLAPPPRRDLPDDKPRRHTLEARDEREYGQRMRSPGDGARKNLEGARRDNRTWNGDDDYEEPRRVMRRDAEPRTVHSTRDRRMRSPRAKSPHAASLAGSDHEDPAAKARNNAANKKKAVRRPGANSTNRESMEKKEHLDFSASSSSVKSFEVSAITQKYLNPKPAKAAMQNTNLKPMIEEDSEEESTRGVSRRKAAPQAYTSERRRNAPPSNQRRHDNKVRGETLSARKMLPPFQRGRPVDASFRDSDEILRERKGSGAYSDARMPSSKNSGAKSSRTLSISDYDGFKETRALLGSDNSFSSVDDDYFSNDEDEALTKLLAASNRGKKDLTAKLRAKKEAIAGIDAASLAAKEKARTTANYKLTKRDREVMRQISELEAIVLQHQKELPGLMDMYSEAIKRSEKAQRELQKAKVRVARYEKAHAAVARAIRTGKLYMEQKEYMAAILELSRATGIERSNATLWYLLAECRLVVGQPAAAEEACLTSLKLQPSGAGVAMLGRILHERGRHDEAIECYLSALGRNDESEDEEDSE
ncbi:hypothetical protein PC129_g14030 [Phytophthora cactorum]|uniref:FYVE-type domain-containing protein n=1 Tax=Phytophthora cactorum TaxID=29920 RepID=A0A8T1G1Y6_9STRA|nr:hypothetical protein Pcac1_g10432 [Phytophthora cactorum]KAG2811781.1 hypothetical protein PC111_g15094 [Phytophthora cactorum]KAG2851190.1 hypothetical protein PC113_g16130 [Phytophthora cactorum]KAG2898235.1 hypothetical protein PC114_g14364 [Phytophthora cactorum]KAG2905252.1 hypothetical protein PC115_g14694 [Phytophthora cactorum]